MLDCLVKAALVDPYGMIGSGGWIFELHDSAAMEYWHMVPLALDCIRLWHAACFLIHNCIGM